MKITVVSDACSFPLDVVDDMELENFKALCEVEFGFPASQSVVCFKNVPLTDNKKSLKDYGVNEGDLVMVTPIQRPPPQMRRNPHGPLGIGQFDFSAIQIPGTSGGVSRPGQMPMPEQPQAVRPGHDPNVNYEQEGGSRGDDLGLGERAVNEDDPAVVRDMLMTNPEQLSLLQHNNPKLYEALKSGDLNMFAVVLKEQQEMRKERDRQRIRLLTADPFDMDAQRQIAQQIEQENINANMEAALEYNPEAFGVVHMLYIRCKVNGHPLKAFIDSGAQTTIMSQACAERCNIKRLVDTRFAGLARGVGVQKILGRVHISQIQIENDFLATSFSVLESQPMDMLLGLDMLKRHQMMIDLKNNQLIIGTTGTRTSFLPESEIPDNEGRRDVEDRQLNETLARSARDQIAPPANNFTEADVDAIVEIGFKRDMVIEELKKHNGNKTNTIAALFAKSLKMNNK